jgi:hypothetical protein
MIATTPTVIVKPSTVAVIVAEPYMITLDGVTHGPGDQLDLPDNELTARWVTVGWVTPTR